MNGNEENGKKNNNGYSKKRKKNKINILGVKIFFQSHASVEN